MKRFLAIAIVLLAAAAVFFVVAPSSAADENDPIEQVIVLIGPSISSECDAATLLVGALPVLEPSLSPVLTPLLPLVGPVVSICGTVPFNPSPSVCAFDVPIQAAIAKLLLEAGVPIPVRFHPIGGFVDQVGVIEGKGPATLQVGLAEALGVTLTCTRLASGPTTPETGAPVAPGGDPGGDLLTGTPSDLGDLGSVGSGGSIEDLGSLGPLDLSSDPAAPTISAPASNTRRIHVSYPITWFLPLVLLFGVVGLGHLFTRDMRDVP